MQKFLSSKVRQISTTCVLDTCCSSVISIEASVVNGSACMSS